MEMKQPDPVLAHWYYTVSEWESFIRWEKKKRGSDILLEGSLVVILGTILLVILRDAPLIWALLVSILIAGLYSIIKYALRMNSLKWKGPGMPEVLITKTSIITNGIKTAFHTDQKWFRRAVINEKADRNILEITYEWQTRKGVTYDEIRLPVPKGKLREAIEIQSFLNAI